MRNGSGTNLIKKHYIDTSSMANITNETPINT